MGSSYELLMYNLSNCEFLNNIDKYENMRLKTFYYTNITFAELF